ncbi:MAG: phenylalanine--tRNA ligase subunit beta [Candidatus Omnitrophica bacterium]|nr:phenylalanine--tRNA ligase subunit beta [Candidatus Omnitrophota bacterium]MBU4477559.1 phenylalanine--tRNA ligase subunit beta [Candidatus Omnitrophota bacterium]
MKLSLNWLKEYVDIKSPANEIARKLTFAGLEVGATEKIGKDSVFEIEITSNRPDWLSHIGVARELAALYATQVKTVRVDLLKPKTKNIFAFSIEIEDRHACARYVGRLIRNVNIKASPQWMAQRLGNVGFRQVNSGADITNYCLYETGQPMHAFDFDKLEGGKIIVRRAKKGESIVTIDGVKRELDPSILVIADAKKPVAVAGIMGGIDTEVTQNTKNILLESAFFDPVTIRRASRKLGLSSESNYRFERKVDIENVLFSSQRAALLYKEIAAGDISEPAVDINYGKQRLKTIKLSISNISRLTGADIPAREIKQILTALGFGVKAAKLKGAFSVTVPSFRNDVSIEEDLIEEVVRIWGYHKVEAAMPVLSAHVEPAYTKQYTYKQRIRQFMLALGLDEVFTYSLLSKKNLEDAASMIDSPAHLINPLSCEQEYMRAALLPSFLKIINLNLNRKNKDIKIFEIGKVYAKQTKVYDEREMLGIALTGNRFHNWQDHARAVDFYDIKGAVELLLERLGIEKYEFKHSGYDFLSAAESVEVVMAGGASCGWFGRVDKKILKNFDISTDVYFAQLDIKALVENIKEVRKFTTLAKYPSSPRDIAIVVKEETAAEEALAIISEVAGGLAAKIELFDVYKGNQIPADHKSLAFSIEYQSRESTLTEEQINTAHSAVQDALLQRLEASLR